MTKRVPGAKRGRGRPSSRVPLHQHPQRYAVALVASMAMVTESERSGAFLYLLYAIDKKGELDQRAIDCASCSLHSRRPPIWRGAVQLPKRSSSPRSSDRSSRNRQSMRRCVAPRRLVKAAWARRILLPPLIKRCSLSPTSPAREDWADRLMVRWYAQARQRPKSRDAS